MSLNLNGRTDKNIIVFDIGGTWFRSGVLTPGNKLISATRRAAINFKNSPGLPITSLQQDLVDYITIETRRLRATLPGETISLATISVGAALNAHTGLILNSGPLWGPCSTPFDLLGALKNRDAGTQWAVVNDITAALLHYASLYEHHGLSKLTLVTVSTGIGCRTYDARSNSVPVDRNQGLQGEIGHLPVSFRYKEQALELICDCGGPNHMNAFCSGRGIEAVIRELANKYPGNPQATSLLGAVQLAPEQQRLRPFAEALAHGSTFARGILESVTLPLANMLLALFTIDPEVERVILTGGVVNALRDTYIETLLHHLETTGLYQISLREPSFFRTRIRIGDPEDNAGLLGAAIAARLHENATPQLKSDILHVANRDSIGPYSWSVQAQSTMSYSVVESKNLFGLSNSLILATLRPYLEGHDNQQLLIVDRRVDKLYGSRIRQYFRHHNVKYRILTLHASERYKGIAAVMRCIQEMDDLGFPRRVNPVIAIGGGVLLDIVGMAASLYRRGVPYLRIPTTLLSLVDTAVGVKVGVNLSGHKNRIGTYYAPRISFLDPTFLQSLDRRQICSGLAEILKVAIVKDKRLFDLLETHGAALLRQKFQSTPYSTLVIRSSIQDMLDELAPNLWEEKLERSLDFGHSFSPAIELMACPRILHGEAVALDMALSSVLAQQRGHLNQGDLNRILELMRTLSLPIENEIFDPPLLYQALQDTTMHRGGLQRLPLPISIGSVEFYNDVSSAEIEAAINELRQRYRLFCFGSLFAISKYRESYFRRGIRKAVAPSPAGRSVRDGSSDS